METVSILQAVAGEAPQIPLLSLNCSSNLADAVITLRRFHLAHPHIPKILLVESCDRNLVISAFRSGVRGIFPVNEANLRLLCRCILRVAAGQIWASTEQLSYL